MYIHHKQTEKLINSCLKSLTKQTRQRVTSRFEKEGTLKWRWPHVGFRAPKWVKDPRNGLIDIMVIHYGGSITIWTHNHGHGIIEIFPHPDLHSTRFI